MDVEEEGRVMGEMEEMDFKVLYYYIGLIHKTLYLNIIEI
jgi:hypothetical protein